MDKLRLQRVTSLHMVEHKIDLKAAIAAALAAQSRK
jgi:hypothetical protein